MFSEVVVAEYLRFKSYNNDVQIPFFF